MTFTDFLSKNRISIISVVGILIIGIVLVIQLDIFQVGSTKTPSDPSFEMIDPENPTTTVDNIFRIKREYEKHKIEKCLISQLKIELQNRIDSQVEGNSATVQSERDFAGQIEGYSVSSLYDFDWGNNYDNCGKFPSSNGLYAFRSMYVFSIYNASINAYSSSSRNILLATNYSRQKIARFTRASYRNVGEFGFIDGTDEYVASYPAAYSQDTLEFKKFDEETANKYRESARKIPVLARTSINTLISLLKKREGTIDTLMTAQMKRYNDLTEKYSKSRLDINDKAIKYGIFAFCFTALTMYLSALLSRASARRKELDDHGKSIAVKDGEDVKLSMWYSVYMITVLLLIITIFILGLARLLTENSLAALLGGIAGYVLNNRLADNAIKPPDIKIPNTVMPQPGAGATPKVPS